MNRDHMIVATAALGTFGGKTNDGQPPNPQRDLEGLLLNLMHVAKFMTEEGVYNVNFEAALHVAKMSYILDTVPGGNA